MSSQDELPANLEAEIRAAGGTINHKLSNVGLMMVSSTDPNFKTKAAGIQGVRSVINDFEAQWNNPASQKVVDLDETLVGNPPNSGDDDIRFDLQWGHDAINAPEAWNAGYRGQGATVAVLDGGFDLDHADLAPNIIGAVSFVPGEGAMFVPTATRTFSHGTHVAGTVAGADNGRGMIGVAPSAKLLLVKVLRDSGSGSFSWILQGILYATEKGADVINLSLGAAIPRNGKFLDEDGNVINDTKAVQELVVMIQRITAFAKKNNVTLIAAAGNDANNGNKDGSLMFIPAGVPALISISATAPYGWALNPATNLDLFSTYSNYGTADVDFAAPGGESWHPSEAIAVVRGVPRPVWVFDLVLSAAHSNAVGNTSVTWSAGTSMASPHAAGVAAIIIGKNGGSMDPVAVEAKLRASADDLDKPGQDPFYGHGRINAFRAVQ
jgi:lantibiotic leader peptide-processing serine protease